MIQWARGVCQGILAREVLVELDAAHIDVLKAVAGVADQFAPVTARPIMKPLVDDTEALRNCRLDKLAVIAGQAGGTAFVIQQFEKTEVPQAEAVYILQPRLDPVTTGHAAAIQLRKIAYSDHVCPHVRC